MRLAAVASDVARIESAGGPSLDDALAARAVDVPASAVPVDPSADDRIATPGGPASGQSASGQSAPGQSAPGQSAGALVDSDPQIAPRTLSDDERALLPIDITLSSGESRLLGAVLSVRQKSESDWAVVEIRLSQDAIHQNPNTSPSILRATRMDGVVKVAGVLPGGIAPRVGDTVDVVGPFRMDPKYGLNFRWKTFSTVVPISLEAAVAWMTRRGVRGVGPATIARLRGAMPGAAFVSGLADKSALMNAGIGEELADAIVAAWGEQTSLAINRIRNEIMGYDIPHAIANKLVSTYKDGALTLIKTDPWRAAIEVKGIGFKRADEIAARVGIASASENRIKAGVLEVLSLDAREGHCGMPWASLIATSSAMLNSSTLYPPLSQIQVAEVVRAMVVSGTLMREPVGPGRSNEALIRTQEIHMAEMGLARKIAGMCIMSEIVRQAMTPFDMNVLERIVDLAVDRINADDQRAALRDGRNFRPMSLHEKQREAVIAMLYLPIAMMTGGPGVGKSATLRVLKTAMTEILPRLSAARPTMRFIAPTGAAALRIAQATGAVNPPPSTIHAGLEFRPGLGDENDNENETDDSDVTGTFRRNANNPLAEDWVGMDEASMTDVELMAALFAAVNPSRTQVGLICDPHQLKSVGPGRVVADYLMIDRAPRVSLTHVYRTGEGSGIAMACEAIRNGTCPPMYYLDDEGNKLKDWLVDTRRDESGIDFILRKATVEFPAEGYDILSRNPARSIMVVAATYSGSSGVVAANLAIKERVNPGDPDHSFHYTSWKKQEQYLSVGDKVIQLCNLKVKIEDEENPGKQTSVIKVARSQIGFVQSMIEEDGSVLGLVVDFGGVLQEYRGKEVRKYLDLGYVITGHKSQGQEAGALVMVAENRYMSRSLAYTGFSRGRERTHVKSDPRTLCAIIQNTKDNERRTALPRLITSFIEGPSLRPHAEAAAMNFLQGRKAALAEAARQLGLVQEELGQEEPGQDGLGREELGQDGLGREGNVPGRSPPSRMVDLEDETPRLAG